MEKLEFLIAGASNLTHTTGEWIVVETARVGVALPLPLETSPEAVAVGAACVLAVSYTHLTLPTILLV